MSKGFRLMTMSCFMVLFFFCGSTGPARAGFPTMLELRTTPDPAGIRDTVLIECRLFAKGASHTTQRAKGGILSVTIYSFRPRIQVNQFLDKPDGQYDLFEFAWNPPRPGRYKIEVSYSGSAFLSAVRTSRIITIYKNRPAAQTTLPRPTTTSIIKFVPSTTIPAPTTTTLPPTTTTWPPTTTTLPPTTTTWPPTTTTLPPTTTTWPPPTTTSLAPPPSTVSPTSGTGLEESTIEPTPVSTTPPPSSSGTGERPSPADQEPLRAADNKIVTKVRLTAKPGPRPGQYLITVQAVTARGRLLEDGDVLITVTGGKLIPGAQGQALISAMAGRQTLVWQKPKKSGNKKYRIEATYFGGTGPRGDYRMASASLRLPPGR